MPLPGEFLKIAGNLPDSWPSDFSQGWLTMRVTEVNRDPVVFAYREKPGGKQFYRTSIKEGHFTLVLQAGLFSCLSLANPAKTVEKTHFGYQENQLIRISAGSDSLESGRTVFVMNFVKQGTREEILLNPAMYSSDENMNLAPAINLSKQQLFMEIINTDAGSGLRFKDKTGFVMLEMINNLEMGGLIISGGTKGWKTGEACFVDTSPVDTFQLSSQVFENFGSVGGALVLKPLLANLFKSTFAKFPA